MKFNSAMVAGNNQEKIILLEETLSLISGWMDGWMDV